MNLECFINNVRKLKETLGLHEYLIGSYSANMQVIPQFLNDAESFINQIESCNQNASTACEPSLIHETYSAPLELLKSKLKQVSAVFNSSEYLALHKCLVHPGLNLDQKKQAQRQMIHELLNLSSCLQSDLEHLSSQLFIPFQVSDSFKQGAANGFWTTLYTRITEKVIQRLPIPDHFKPGIVLAANRGFVVKFATDGSWWFLTALSHVATFGLVRHLKFSPRTQRQAATVAGITVQHLPELYAAPTLEGVLNLTSTAAGSCLGILAFDLAFDAVEKGAELTYQYLQTKPTPRPKRRTELQLLQADSLRILRS